MVPDPFDSKHAGKVRYIGFTGHNDPHIDLLTLHVAKEHDFCKFEAVPRFLLRLWTPTTAASLVSRSDIASYRTRA